LDAAAISEERRREEIAKKKRQGRLKFNGKNQRHMVPDTACHHTVVYFVKGATAQEKKKDWDV
jgi:hypothetical protein